MEAQITAAVQLPSEVQMALSKQKRVQRIDNEHFFRIHPELRGMISAFMSALLKEKPDDVDLFAENFFTQPDLAHQLGFIGWTRPPTPEIAPEMVAMAEAIEALETEDDEGGLAGGTTDMDPLELEHMLIALFKEADRDGSGSLEFHEFAELMSTASIGLNKAEVKLLLAEADENSDGQVTYQEFVPLAVEVIQTMRLKERAEEEEAELDDIFREAANEAIGMTPREVEEMVIKKVGGDGTLTRPQLKALLKAPQLGLSKQQAALASNLVDFDANGSIAASVLAPNLYSVIVDAVAKALSMQNLGMVGEEIERICGFYDKDESGFLDRVILKQAIQSNFQFLSTFQLNALVNDPRAPTNAEGAIAWREYLPKLTALIKAMGDPAAIHERMEMAARAEFQPAALMNGQEQAEFVEMMKGFFMEADTDNNGTLDKAEFLTCLKQAELGLVDGEILGLFDMFDQDMSGSIDMEEFLEGAYDILADLARERALADHVYG